MICPKTVTTEGHDTAGVTVVPTELTVGERMSTTYTVGSTQRPKLAVAATVFACPQSPLL